MTTKTRTRPSERLAELDRKLKEAQAQADAASQEHDAALRRVPQLEHELAQAIAEGKPTEKLEAALAEARREREKPWSAIRSVAAEKVRETRQERSAYISENIEDLVAELDPQADEVVEKAKAQMRGVIDALNEWALLSAEATRLLNEVPGLDGQDLPFMPVQFEVLRRELGRALAAELPAPMPMSIGPKARAVPPKSKSSRGGYVPTLLNDAKQVVPQ